MPLTTNRDKWTLFFLSLGHFINDSYSNFLGPLLPLLLIKLKMSLAQAGWLVAIQVFSSSFMQPLYGYLSDRYLKRAFVVFSPLVTALFMSFIGVVPNYWMLALLLFLGGIGIASFHPQAASMASSAMRRQQGMGMSLFVTAGSLGYALGPILITTLVAWVGLERSYIVLVPGVLTFALLFFLVPPPVEADAHQPKRGLVDLLKPVWKPLLVLYLLVVLRSLVQMCLVNFLPVYLTGKGMSGMAVGRVTTLFLFCGAAGGFAGGSLADQFGEKRIITLSMFLSAPFLLGFQYLNGPASFLFLALGGIILFSTVPVNVVMAQKLIPQSSGTVSALMMGFAWGVGGLMVPLFGKLADLVGLENAFLLVPLLPFIGFLLALRLQKTIIS
jgi:MFS transporter, FSR family, fosmidomycin resistance protein